MGAQTYHSALEKFEPRVCIMGPSNSGKSTLADAIGCAYDLPIVHLDRLFHQPKTDWQSRPAAEFQAFHDQAILASAWVIDGNYSRCLSRGLLLREGCFCLSDKIFVYIEIAASRSSAPILYHG
ncbi:MAG: hypothetical protein ACRYGI_07055 [Janthinobacterium lividum]